MDDKLLFDEFLESKYNNVNFCILQLMLMRQYNNNKYCAYYL